tara:strand:+ start:10690 stop:11121 length:432 start_codon:yes stop_codon:yes gene_type:complete
MYRVFLSAEPKAKTKAAETKDETKDETKEAAEAAAEEAEKRSEIRTALSPEQLDVTWEELPWTEEETDAIKKYEVVDYICMGGGYYDTLESWIIAVKKKKDGNDYYKRIWEDYPGPGDVDEDDKIPYQMYKEGQWESYADIFL